MPVDPPTAQAAEWLDPAEHPPPRGCKLQLLNFTGTAVHGDWRDNAGFIAWAPLLKIPPSIKAKLGNYQHYARTT